MIEFQRPEYLWLLILLPLIVWWSFFKKSSKKNRLENFASTIILNRLIYLGSITQKRHLRVFPILAFIFVIIAIANPGKYKQSGNLEVKKVPITIALDISNSMRAEDVSPSRLERAKLIAAKLVETLKGDHLSLIEFAGSADVVVPFTIDKNTLTQQLALSEPEFAPSQGTDFSILMDVYHNQLITNDINGGVMIILSDGEHHGSDFDNILKKINRRNIRIFTIGVGTEKGGYIPMKGNTNSAYKTDERGNLIRSELQREVLTEIADKTNGKYFLYTQMDEALKEISEYVSSLEGSKVIDFENMEFKGYFRLFTCMAIVSMALYISLMYKIEF